MPVLRSGFPMVPGQRCASPVRILVIDVKNYYSSCYSSEGQIAPQIASRPVTETSQSQRSVGRQPLRRLERAPRLRRKPNA